MVIKDWKFKTKEGIILTEHDDYPDDIRAAASDLDLPDNALSFAKVLIYNEDLQDVVFYIDDVSVEVPTDLILSFDPFMRGITDGQSSGVDSGELLYLLDGKEYSFKKKPEKKPDLTILQKLAKLNLS